MRWAHGRVSVEDSVQAPRAVRGEWLRDHFFSGISSVTAGLVQFSFETLWFGPIKLLRFGEPVESDHEVSWPIEGGLLAAAPGGYFTVRGDGGLLTARITGYRPSLPPKLYELTQLQVHHGLVRQQLLWMRGRIPAAGIPANPLRRGLAGAIDVGLCAGIAMAVSRRRRFTALAAITAGYHVACWAGSGRTIGGFLMGQRVVAVDGSKPSVVQAALRMLALPVAAFKLRAVHDEVAATDVVEERRG
jgi:RDD family